MSKKFDKEETTVRVATFLGKTVRVNAVMLTLTVLANIMKHKLLLEWS